MHNPIEYTCNATNHIIKPQPQFPNQGVLEVEYDRVFDTVHCKPFDFDIQIV